MVHEVVTNSEAVNVLVAIKPQPNLIYIAKQMSYFHISIGYHPPLDEPQ